MKNLKCSIFKIATCEAFLINTKKLSFSKKKKKTRKLCIVQNKSHESKHSFYTFYISLPNFRALGPVIKIFYYWIRHLNLKYDNKSFVTPVEQFPSVCTKLSMLRDEPSTAK